MSDKERTYPRRLLSVDGSLYIVIALLLLVILLSSYAVHRWFDHDEFEHIHSAWYVANGSLPYIDFFQNHHPLLYYCMAPLLLAAGYSIQTVILLRMTMFGLTIGIACMTYLIAQRVTSSQRASLLSVLLLLSMVMFVEKSIEIRPDVPQVLLGLISVYFFMSFIQVQQDKYIVLAGITASVSFLFLQKSLFLLLAYGVLLCYGLLRRRIPLRSIVYFVVSFSPPAILLLSYLLLTGTVEEYVLTNWLVNMHWLQAFSPFRYLSRSFASQNALFWLLSPISVGMIILAKKTDHALRATAFIGAVLLLWVFFIRPPFRQCYMFAIPLLCVVTGCFLERLAARFELRGIHIMILVIAIVSQPLLFIAPRSIWSGLRDKQLERVQFVLDNSADHDLVYDGNAHFNLFRGDLHYFWLSVGENKGLDTYNAITNSKYGDYDICQLIHSRLPSLVSNYELDVIACGLRALYDQTQYEGLYVRRDLESLEHHVWRDFGGVLALLGYGVEEITVDGEHRLQISLWWQVLTEMDIDYTIFVHVVGADGTILTQVDDLFTLGTQTSSTLTVGKRERQDFALVLPADAPNEVSAITVGLYYWETGERLPVWDEYGQRIADDFLSLSS